MAIDLNNPVPVYLQIADEIRRAVAAGVYQPGEMIPSLRAMALQLVVNPNTVQRAYEELEREGLIQVRKGLGMLVTSNGVASAQAHSEATVHATFVQGIRAAEAAKLPPQRVRDAFDQAWEAVHPDARNHHDHPIPPVRD